MADGKWTMTGEDAKRVDLSFSGSAKTDQSDLPNRGKHIYVDDRDGKAERKCAFCGSREVEAGSGGFGEGFGYRTLRCSACGGMTELVYKDTVGKFF